MQRWLKTTKEMAEEGSCTYLIRRLSCAFILRAVVVLLLIVLGIYSVFCSQQLAQQHRLESPAWDIAELQLNHTGPRMDPRLHWQGGPELGRSFLRGPQLNKGQLLVRRDGIYRLHIQVTLSNCSSFPKATTWPRATLAVGICSPATRSISLLRLNFYLSCTVASQRLTPLAHGDILCTNLTLPLLPSQNADETFFGIQWVHP
ncbi:CD70 molecule [Rhinolophus ferrumequinum]|uniref:CD70 antigen n=2 Tax=Rhinolophus ferrumequinum TaxID=59479 RepID=A0A7J7TZE6_RHIFE|nr:CD70 antigen [Rhinolophus ferrumequinum]KAF6305935.1 CD70 molecule [Rhinolophus ferrumequinum]